ncbi:DUF1153 domain-containing protein [Hymenobacter properus]|uniref:DUF1153 domain-containing protein n=1 Tax=Hymenobacter properus TaxID=2791026 RepID=A0A931BKG1_9BACT|nr:DUF1153 domain-containing protein [Hymenobacter properus]MBF9141903.1 DUF1153 domain-containing protein [Hymenobacter properus]MBR7720711.1 DUF1153 domain-containing protein [Microvirga sp. SRT04]
MNELEPNYYDTDGRPEPARDASADAERKLKVWAVLNAVDQGLMNAEEACTAYGISAEEMDEHRAGWMDFEAGSR